MAFVLSLIALLIAFAGGAGAVMLMAPSRVKESLCGFAGASLLLGAGIVSVTSFCLGLLIQGALLRWTVTLLCGMLLIAGIRASHGAWRIGRPKWNAGQFALAILVVSQICFVTWLSLYKYGLGWDGMFNWEAKAHIAFRYHGAIPLSFYSSGYEVSHVSYPLFLPLLQVWMYEWLGRIDQSMIKLIGPYLFLGAVLLLIGTSTRQGGGRWVAVIAIVLFGATPALMLGEGSVSTAYADFPLAVIWLCALVHSIEYWRTGSLAAARLTGMSAMLLPFVKNDGTIGLLCTTIAVMPKAIQDRNWKAVAWMLAPGFGLLLAWHGLQKLGHFTGGDLLPITPANLLLHLNRAGGLLHLALEELTTRDRWGLLWPAAIAAAAVLGVRRQLAEWYPLAVNALLPLVLYPAVFFFSAWQPFEVHVQSALPRLFVHNAPAAILLVAVACGSLLEFGTAQELSPARLQVILNRAAKTLRPTGITVEHLRDLYQNIVVAKAAQSCNEKTSRIAKPRPKRR
jgi:hypothetical protein